MKNLRSLTFALLAASMLIFSSCGDDDDVTPTIVPDLTINQVKDLDGGAGKDSVYFSLALNKEVTSTEAWDLKFKGTTISTSGTAQLVALSSGILFESYDTAPATGFVAAPISGSSSWYNYTAETEPMHAILPVPGKIILVKTTGGKYAKIEMLSYYKGNPSTTTDTFKDLTTRPASKIYTFRYAYQADGTTDLK